MRAQDAAAADAAAAAVAATAVIPTTTCDVLQIVLLRRDATATRTR